MIAYIRALGVRQPYLGAQISGNGFASGLRAELESPIGWTGELGMYFAETWHLAAGFGIRYTFARYELAGDSIDASNLGFNITMHVNP